MGNKDEKKDHLNRVFREIGKNLAIEEDIRIIEGIIEHDPDFFLKLIKSTYDASIIRKEEHSEVDIKNGKTGITYRVGVGVSDILTRDKLKDQRDSWRSKFFEEHRKMVFLEEMLKRILPVLSGKMSVQEYQMARE